MPPHSIRMFLFNDLYSISKYDTSLQYIVINFLLTTKIMQPILTMRKMSKKFR